MKPFLIVMLSFICVQSFSFAVAVDWSNVELNGQYSLNQNIVFPGVFEFHKGDHFEVIDFIGGYGPTMYYQVHFENCQDPDQEAELILVKPIPEDVNRDRSVGIQLETGCNLGIFIEPYDYYTPSIFSDE